LDKLIINVTVGAWRSSPPEKVGRGGKRGKGSRGRAELEGRFPKGAVAVVARSQEQIMEGGGRPGMGYQGLRG